MVYLNDCIEVRVTHSRHHTFLRSCRTIVCNGSREGAAAEKGGHTKVSCFTEAGELQRRAWSAMSRTVR